MARAAPRRARLNGCVRRTTMEIQKTTTLVPAAEGASAPHCCGAPCGGVALAAACVEVFFTGALTLVLLFNVVVRSGYIHVLWALGATAVLLVTVFASLIPVWWLSNRDESFYTQRA